jgi:hypothetical protein
VAAERLWRAAGFPSDLAGVALGMRHDELRRLRPAARDIMQGGPIEVHGADTLQFEFPAGRPSSLEEAWRLWRKPDPDTPLSTIRLTRRADDSTVTALWYERVRTLRAVASDAVRCYRSRQQGAPSSAILLAAVEPMRTRSAADSRAATVLVFIDSTTVGRVELGSPASASVHRSPARLASLVVDSMAAIFPPGLPRTEMSCPQ